MSEQLAHLEELVQVVQADRPEVSQRSGDHLARSGQGPGVGGHCFGRLPGPARLEHRQRLARLAERPGTGQEP